MKTIEYTQYGSPEVLQFKEREKPVPKDNQILIQVRATSLNVADKYTMRGEPFVMRFGTGLFKPKNPKLGIDVAGRVEAIGKNVTQFKPGDEVYGDVYNSGLGAFAEYVCADEQSSMVLKPKNATFEEAAAVPVSGLTALQGIRDKGQIQAGQKVLINGATGGVGTFAVQIAKAFGAEVTAVCSTSKMDLVRSLGADHVIDYTKENFTQSGKQYDLIIGVNGYHSLSDYKRALTPQGSYVAVGGTMKQIFQSLLLGSWFSRKGGKTLGNMGMAQANKKDLNVMKELIETGKIKPAIDQQYPFSEIQAAMRYLEEGHAKGKVVVTIN